MQEPNYDPTIRLWAWCEIDHPVMRSYPRTEEWMLYEESRFGGWEYKGRYENGVETFATDRHISLQVHANTEEEAKTKFRIDPTFRSCEEETNG